MLNLNTALFKAFERQQIWQSSK